MPRIAPAVDTPCIMATRVKIKWDRDATIPARVPLSQALDTEEFARGVARAAAHPYPAFRIADDVFLEIPPPSWGHGEFLVYLPSHHCLVRRGYVEHWYVDIGLFKAYDAVCYRWTDLWLDVIAPEPATSYQVLDLDEFAQALRSGEISTDNAVLALDSLHRLLTLIRDGAFPMPEVRLAEAAYERYTSDGAL